VKQGQTLQQIAIQYQVNIQSIALANGLSLDTELRTGQALKIPISGRVSITPQTSTSSLVASADLGQIPTVGNRDPLESLQEPETNRSSALDRLRQQRDKLRDSLAGLRREEPAQAANSSNSDDLSNPEASSSSRLSSAAVSSVTTQATIARALAALPTLSPTSESQTAEMQPSGVSQTVTVGEQVAVHPSRPEVSTSGIQTHRVNPGDTIARIARAYNIPQSLLISANRLSDPNVIFVGQTLTVPTLQSATPQPPVAVASERLSAGVLPTVTPIGSPIGSTALSATANQSAADSIQPAVNPVTPTAPALVAQTAQGGAMALSDALPSSTGRQIAVAPLLEGSANPDLAAPDPALPPRAMDAELPSRFNPYVANLLSELRGLKERNQSESIAVVQPTAETAPGVDRSVAAGDLAVAPHFSDRISRRNAETLPVSSPVAVQLPTASPDVAQPSLVAAAPLGSESYDPLLQPVTGRLVSPDLPPLPGADTFLPEDGLFNGYIWPARGMLTSGYGWRWGRMHQGIDIASDVGTPIHAAATGVVEFAGWNSGGYGNMVEIRHADGSMTRYAHMNSIYARVGQEVNQGEQIGEMGSTGYSTGPHLHFEVHLPNQGTVNPIAYLPTGQQTARQ
jgi:murein DD-endopeptidase MepM/ murein hydrolase activator NlpD